MRILESYPDYAVSPFGKIYSYKSNKWLKEKTTKTGYKQICIRSGGRYKTVLVHRLVAEAYLGKSNLDVNHKDGDKSNNLPRNLEYVTKSQNHQHRVNVLFAGCKGLTLMKDNLSITFKSQKEAAQITGLSQQSISSLFTGTRKSAKGWSLKETTVFTEMKNV